MEETKAMQERFVVSRARRSYALLHRPLEILLSLLLLTSACSVHAQDRVTAARTQIEAAIAKSGAEAAVIWRPLDARPGEEIVINPALRFHAASTMKVPIMIELYRQRDAGALRLDDTMIVTNTFHSIVDGSDYQLSASEDSDGEVYTAIGKSMTLRQLVMASIRMPGAPSCSGWYATATSAPLAATMAAMRCFASSIESG